MLVSPQFQSPKLHLCKIPSYCLKTDSYKPLLLSVLNASFLYGKRGPLLEVPHTINRHNKSLMLLIYHPHRYNITWRH